MVNAICLLCGDEDAVVSVSLTEDHEFHCAECDGTFTVEHVEKVIAGWGPVLQWLKVSPFRCEKPGEVVAAK
jgi:hypothetical protein